MRKITEQSLNAFLNHRNFKKDNTEVKRYNLEGEYALYLFGNRIAWWKSGKIWISNRGYFTQTTKERLNALPNVHIIQKKGEWYLNGVYWNGNPICVDCVVETFDLRIDGDS